jgi:3D (Asp-Asp-Asp) domain-containing protein
MPRAAFWLVPAALLATAACASAGERTLVVTATAYNSVPEQTNEKPSLGAWGDALQPGMRAIAVSRDLITMGLIHRAVVTIEGLPGEYLVLDKMAARWEKKIDIYMGEDVEAARQWGERRVRIRWKASE